MWLEDSTWRLTELIGLIETDLRLIGAIHFLFRPGSNTYMVPLPLIPTTDYDSAIFIVQTNDATATLDLHRNIPKNQTLDCKRH